MKRSIGFGALALATVLSLGLLLPGAAQAGCQSGPPPDFCDRCVSDGFGCCQQAGPCFCIDMICAAPSDDGSAAVLLAAIFRPAEPAPASPAVAAPAAKAAPVPAASPAR